MEFAVAVGIGIGIGVGIGVGVNRCQQTRFNPVLDRLTRFPVRLD